MKISNKKNFPELEGVEISENEGDYFIVIDKTTKQLDTESDALQYCIQIGQILLVYNWNLVSKDQLPKLLISAVTSELHMYVDNVKLTTFYGEKQNLKTFIYNSESFLIDTGATHSSLAKKNNYKLAESPQKMGVEVANGSKTMNATITKLELHGKIYMVQATVTDTSTNVIGMDVLKDFSIQPTRPGYLQLTSSPLYPEIKGTLTRKEASQLLLNGPLDEDWFTHLLSKVESSSHPEYNEQNEFVLGGGITLNMQPESDVPHNLDNSDQFVNDIYEDYN